MKGMHLKSEIARQNERYFLEKASRRAWGVAMYVEVYWEANNQVTWNVDIFTSLNKFTID